MSTKLKKNFVATSLTSDKIHQYGLHNLAYPEQPLFQQLLAIHVLLSNCFETVVPFLAAAIKNLSVEQSAAFEIWLRNKKGVTIDDAAMQLATSFAYFIYHGFEEHNRLNFEIKFINTLSEYEAANFNRVSQALKEIKLAFFNMIDWEFKFGAVFQDKNVKLSSPVDERAFRNGLEKFYESDDVKYNEQFQGLLDKGKFYPEMAALGNDSHYKMMVPDVESNFLVNSSNLQMFNCQIKESNLDADKIHFSAQQLHNYAAHHHRGDVESARGTMRTVLSGDGTLDQVRTFRGYLPLGNKRKMDAIRHDDYQEYLDEMERKGMGSPFEVLNPWNIVTSHKYGDEGSSSSKQKYYDEIEKGERIAAEEADTDVSGNSSFGISMPAFVKPAYQLHKFTGSDVKALREERDKLYAALVRCNEDKKKYYAKRKELLNTDSFNDVVTPDEDSSNTENAESFQGKSFGCHFTCNMSDHMNVHPMLFETLSIRGNELIHAQDFKQSLVELYGKENLTAFEMEAKKFDVSTVLSLLKDNGEEAIDNMMEIIFSNMYEMKLRLMGMNNAVEREESTGFIKTLPYHKQLTKKKEYLKQKLIEKKNAALDRTNGERELDEDEEDNEELEIRGNPIIEEPDHEENEKQLAIYGKNYDLTDHIESKNSKEINSKLLLSKEVVVDEDNEVVTDVLGNPETITTVKIPKSLDVSKYTSFILSFFKGGIAKVKNPIEKLKLIKESDNRLVGFAQKITRTMVEVINKWTEKVRSVGGDLPALVDKIKGIIGQLDYIKGPIKGYAVRTINFIPTLVKTSQIEQGAEKVLKFLTSALGQLMQAVPKVFSFVIENKQLWATALNLIKNVGTYGSKGVALLSKGGGQITTNIGPLMVKSLGTVGKSTKLLTAVGNGAGALVKF